MNVFHTESAVFETHHLNENNCSHDFSKEKPQSSLIQCKNIIDSPIKSAATGQR